METAERVDEFRTRWGRIREEIGLVMVGQESLIDGVLVGLFAGGHCLLEGVPGLGKTQLVKTLSRVFGLEFSRIQFTPDLMPADVVGTHIITEDESGRKTFDFRRGPIFANLVLADEINRATPKTQSALLEAMQERTVTSWGTTHTLSPPMFVLATQNPIEMEGTYPLPEAQVDRFMFKLIVERPTTAELNTIISRTTAPAAPEATRVMDRDEFLAWTAFVAEVVIAPHVVDYASRLVAASHPGDPGAPESVREFARYGCSPRAGQSLVVGAKVLALLDGRLNVSYRDIRAVAAAAMRHRIILKYQAQLEGVTGDTLVADCLQAVTESVSAA